MNQRLLLVRSVVPLIVGAMALAASVTVRVGGGGGDPYYFNDSTPADNRVTVKPGDTITFVVDDNGGNQAHTVEVDAFGWHSGSLAKAGTYTVTVPDQPGEYILYCKPHRQRGHVGTLVVLGDPVPTTTAAATTTTTAGATTTTTAAPTVTTVTAGDTTTTVAPEAATTTTVAANDITTTSADNPTAPGNAPEHSNAGGQNETTTTTSLLAAGDEPGADLAALEIDLEPWTRSVRLALLGLLPVAVLALAAGIRQHQRKTPQKKSP